MKDFVAIDFETANGKRSSVCSMGMIVVCNGVIADKYYTLIRPVPNYYSFWTTKIHGLAYYDTIHAPTFKEIWEAMQPKIGNLPLVAHNSPFDSSCLRAVHEAYEMVYNEYEFHCTLKAARKCLPGLANYQLHTVAEHVGYNLQDHHNALADAEACAAIALQIL
jgi:DNA polymerase III, epsilon subunit and related 3''-5'' exonucleases